MSNINPAYRNRARFFLDNSTIGRKIVDEPIGWDEDQKEYARHKRHGIFPQMSSSLKFIGETQNLLNAIWEVEGLKAEIILIKEEKHPHTNAWVRSYWGFLDMLTREVEDGVLSFKFNSGGVEKLRASRESQKVEIESLTTIDGETLPELETELLELDGRRIFLKTDYDIEPSNNNAYLYNETSGQTRGCTVCVPLNLTSKSHEKAQSPLPNTLIGDNSHDRSENGTTGIMFFANNDTPRTLRVRFDISFNIQVLNYDELNWTKFWFSLARYGNGANFDYIDRTNLLFADNSLYTYVGQTLTYSFDQIIYLNQGESLSLQFCQLMDGQNGEAAHLEISCDNIICDLTVEEDSSFRVTTTKFVFAHELIKRLFYLTTGTKTEFYSEALGLTDLGYAIDGKASLKGYAHGMWIRNYDKLPDIPENRYKAFTTNLKDVLDDLEVTDNLGLGIERIGYTERYIIEPREYFYQDTVAHRLPFRVQKVKRKVSENNLFGSISIGFNKGFENEEAQGLDDYHANSDWSTTLGMVKNVYQKLSNFIASSYAVEFIRRVQRLSNPSRDHSNDKNIFIFDLKRYTNDLFKEKKWEDQLEELPSGVFSPETATKLLYSPLNLLLRHAKFFSVGFTKFKFDFTRFGGAEGNKNLVTEPIGGVERQENTDIQNIEFERPLFLPEEIEFEHIVDFETNQKLQGYTEINGRKVPNLYLIWEFENEYGKIEKGFIENVKLNGEGKWIFLKANR